MHLKRGVFNLNLRIKLSYNLVRCSLVHVTIQDLDGVISRTNVSCLKQVYFRIFKEDYLVLEHLIVKIRNLHFVDSDSS
jgi:hypothetical protein